MQKAKISVKCYKMKKKIIFKSIYLCIWIFFCIFAPKFVVRIGARIYVYDDR